MTEMPDISEYIILIEGTPSDNNYSAWSPDVLGCVSAGDTIAETVANMREALAFHIETMVEDGDQLPDAMGPGIYVTVTDAEIAAMDREAAAVRHPTAA